MPGIADTNKIDLVAQEADGTVILVMFEERPWGCDPRQSSQLQEKINLYVGYVLDGSLARQYPETTGKPVRIRLDCAEMPTGHIAHITAHAASQLRARSIEFQINLRN
ncbi:DUF6572 domain-containing protein [Microbacterium xanthum]|uniref:DUF6572 domain-containing protein n=1 Tax=Microbacterium xanthum TaxID=3079794 RepID=UPI002AD322EC|nr:DUF6572 domain-containing protein [Microbacterium sp. KSW-48]MDZ8171638.1 DUF6572 domain-containing protein [Microbacterium sp. KSW-48]